MIVELELGDAAPRHVLEEADVDAATAPGAPRDDDGSVGFSLVTADGRSSLGSTFLPARARPARLRGAPSRARRPLRARDRRRAHARACGPAPARSRSTAGHSSAPSRGSDGCSSPPATGHGESRPARRRRRHVAALVLGEADPRSADVAAATEQRPVRRAAADAGTSASCRGRTGRTSSSTPGRGGATSARRTRSQIIGLERGGRGGSIERTMATRRGGPHRLIPRERSRHPSALHSGHRDVAGHGRMLATRRRRNPLAADGQAPVR